jgi:single-stranded DNA-binding protein
MSKSINRVFLLGNVGQEPDVYQTHDGIVVNISLATLPVWVSSRSATLR